MNEHEFALFYPDLSNVLEKSQTLISINDKEIVHRISRILRLQLDEHMVLFDQKIHVQVQITSISKNEIAVAIKKCEKNKVLTPHITIRLGLLKRDALQEAIENLTVLGVNEIQLFTSEKINRAWGGAKEFDRLERLMIAAAEQSKQFVLPKLHEPITFSSLAHTKTETNVFCDPQGTSFLELICSSKELSSLTIMIGPEGDLSDNEKEQLKKKNYQFCRLTSPILRAELATTIVAGIVRSL